MSDEEILARLLYRDGLILVIDKPAGLPVHRGPRNSYDKSGATVEDSFDALRFGLPRPPVLAHRLDRDTSGCLVLGRHRKATATLDCCSSTARSTRHIGPWSRADRKRMKARSTIALGRLDEERGWWQKPDPNGLPSLTKWKVLGRRWHDMAGAGTDHRTHASIARALARRWLVDRRRQHLWQCAAQRRRNTSSACARDCHSIIENKPPVRVTAPVPEHMRERLRACGWNGEEPSSGQ